MRQGVTTTSSEKLLISIKQSSYWNSSLDSSLEPKVIEAEIDNTEARHINVIMLASPKERKEAKEENLTILENNKNKMNLCDALTFVKIFEEPGEENYHLFLSQVDTALSFVG